MVISPSIFDYNDKFEEELRFVLSVARCTFIWKVMSVTKDKSPYSQKVFRFVIVSKINVIAFTCIHFTVFQLQIMFGFNFFFLNQSLWFWKNYIAFGLCFLTVFLKLFVEGYRFYSLTDSFRIAKFHLGLIGASSSLLQKCW